MSATFPAMARLPDRICEYRECHCRRSGIHERLRYFIHIIPPSNLPEDDY